MTDPSKDELKLAKSSMITKSIGGEQILLSQKVYKINQKNKSQQRTILITDKAIYNISTGLFFKGMEIKRRIKLLKIAGIT